MKNEKSKTILFVVPTMRKGGMERVVSLLANNYSINNNVHIITLTSHIVNYDIDSRVEMKHMSLLNSTSKILLFKNLIQTFFKLKPDVVIGFSEVFNPLTIIVSKICKLKVFISDRSNPLIRYSFRDKWLKKITYIFADGIIAQTSLAKQVLAKKRLNKNIFVIPNPVSTFINTSINPKNKKIISIGRLIESKNHMELIKIFELTKNNEWELLIAGDGKCKEELQNYIDSKHLNHKVKLLGNIDDIELILNMGSIFAFTSLSEGFPNVILEALCYPLATIAYDCPAGVSDLIENNVNGILIPINNQSKYVKCLNELMDSENDRLKLMTNSLKSRELYEDSKIAEMLLNYIK